jgi:hypothetical protein
VESIAMVNFILPYEPKSTAHRDDEQKHIETKKWLSHRIDEFQHSPSIVPQRPQFSSGSKVQQTEQPQPECRRGNGTEPIMPIVPFLRGQAFERETIVAMSAAFSRACKWLGLVERTDQITELVANHIIELAERGIRSKTTLFVKTIVEFKAKR